MLLKVQDNGFLPELCLLNCKINRKSYQTFQGMRGLPARPVGAFVLVDRGQVTSLLGRVVPQAIYDGGLGHTDSSDTDDAKTTDIYVKAAPHVRILAHFRSALRF
jgi:hypothetical protein